MMPLSKITSAVTLGVCLALTGCDSSDSIEPPLAIAPVSHLSTEPSQERTEHEYTVPGEIAPDVFAQAAALAEQNACGSRAMLLPAGTRVRVVEEGGVRRVFYGPGKSQPAYTEGTGALAGNPEKGDGIINAYAASALAPGGTQSSSMTEFSCKCTYGEQNQQTGCTPAYNPNSGHTYCDAYGDCNQCSTIISPSPGEG